MKKKYIKMWGEDGQGLYDAEMVLLNYGKQAKDRYGFGIEEGMAHFKDYYMSFYLTDTEQKRSAEKGYNFYIDKKNLEKFIQESEKDCARIIKNIKALVKDDITKINENDFKEKYKKYSDMLEYIFISYSITQPEKVAKLENTLKNFIIEQNKNNVDKIFTKITSPDIKHEFVKDHIFMEKSFDELLSREDISIDTGIVNKNLYNEKKENIKERDGLIEELKPSGDIGNVIRALQIISQQRLKMRIHWMLELYYYEYLLIEIKRRYGLKKQDLKKYFYKEIDDLVIKGSKVDEKILKEREQSLIAELQNEEIIIKTGQEAEEYIKEIIDVGADVKILKGMVVSPGKAQGKVVNLSYKEAKKHSEKINNMKQGDIIVTEMTRPNIVPAMKKAAAVITDEGGITSHAAIVCREMKIPGVVGTKNATEVLKDGDEVEVDAEKGIVKKIK